MSPADSVETELKLQLDPRHIDRLKRSAVLAKAAYTEVDVENVYLDTADRLLHRHRMALRLRRIDGRWLQTLKIADKRGGALSRRGEWETPARVVRGQGRLDMGRLAATPLPELLGQQESTPVLRPLFRTRFRRRRWLIERAGTTIEVALDVGAICVDGQGAPRRESICEVELELKQGQPVALIDFALELLGTARKSAPALTPIARSKAERGYQLVAQQPAAAVKASAKGFNADLTRKATTARALRAVVAHGLAVTTLNGELVMRSRDVEHVHQARVAMRRVRSAMRLFDRKQRDVPQSFADELRWLARALGEARDWDVIAGATLPSLAQGIGADAARALAEKAEPLRAAAAEKIRNAVRSARYTALVLNGERWCMTPAPAGAELLGDAAAPALRKAANKLFKAARFFSALTPERRHEVRILAKRLRYALDLFAVALPKQGTARYIDALAELQDVLGELNDASVAQQVLPQLSRSARLKKSAQAWFASVEPGRMHEAERRLLKLSAMQTPWE